jgi:hypothetical protein
VFVTVPLTPDGVTVNVIGATAQDQPLPVADAPPKFGVFGRFGKTTSTEMRPKLASPPMLDTTMV